MIGKESFSPPTENLQHKFDRPEDELETTENIKFKKRERAFVAEGKFSDMLALKATLEVLETKFSTRGSLHLPLHQFQSLIDGLLNNPRMYAVATLDVPIDKAESISDEELNAKMAEYLQNKFKPQRIEYIDNFLIELRRYEVGQHSKALHRVIYALEEMKKQVNAGNWRGVAVYENTVNGYIAGISDMLSMTLGDRREGEAVLKRFGLQTNDER